VAEGFEWIDTTDRENSTIVYARKGIRTKEQVVIVLNMTPIPRTGYRIGVPAPGSSCSTAMIGRFLEVAC
jgi:1,4-alpha-glucan branching enzyme